MNWILIITGFAIIATAVADVLLTTLQCKGAGFLSNKISRGVWNVVYLLAGKSGRNKLLDFAGLVVVISVIFTWILLLYIGFSLIYLADSDSIITSNSKMPADISDKIYFVGYTLFTLGNGDFSPSSDFYQAVTVICTGAGLFLITLSITYILPVVSAVVEMRELSFAINSLGKNPEKWLNTAWNGSDYKQLDDYLQDLNNRLLTHCEKHLAYPVIHFFHNSDLRYAAPVNIAILNEVVILLSDTIPESSGPDKLKLHMLQKSLDNYTETLASLYNMKSPDAPPAPDAAFLKKYAPDAELSSAGWEKYSTRRSVLLAAVRKDGWSWDDVTG